MIVIYSVKKNRNAYIGVESDTHLVVIVHVRDDAFRLGGNVVRSTCHLCSQVRGSLVGMVVLIKVQRDARRT